MSKVKLFKPYVTWRAIWNVIRVLRSGQLAEGLEVKKFEKEFGDKFGFQNVVAVNSGTSALELAYELAGIGENDEVITSVLTCTATNIPLLHRKANIVFADIDYDLNINIEDVKKKITPRTKAIVFVHFGGNNRGLTELLRLCQSKSITLIEDAAQAVGSDYWGKGDFTCVSLQAIKTLTSGDGGFLITKRREDYEKARRLRWFGYDREEKQKKGDTDLTEAGYKYHLGNVLASVGRGNLACIDKVIKYRKEIIKIYRSYGMFAHAWLAGGFVKSHHSFLGSSDGYGMIKKLMLENGIEIGQHHYRNDKYTIFRPFKTDCPIMDSIERDYFFVPSHHGVSKKQAHLIGQLYKKYAT